MALVPAFLSQTHKAEKTDEPLHVKELKKAPNWKIHSQQQWLEMSAGVTQAGKNQGSFIQMPPSTAFCLCHPSRKPSISPKSWQRERQTDTTPGLIGVVAFFPFKIYLMERKKIFCSLTRNLSESCSPKEQGSTADRWGGNLLNLWLAGLPSKSSLSSSCPWQLPGTGAFQDSPLFQREKHKIHKAQIPLCTPGKR